MLQHKLISLHYDRPCQIYSSDNTNTFYALQGSWICAYIYIIKRPSWCLLPLYSVTDSVQERRLRLLCSPPRTERHGHMTSRCLHSCRLKAYHVVFLIFQTILRDMSMFDCITWKLNFNTFKGSKKCHSDSPLLSLYLVIIEYYSICRLVSVVLFCPDLKC